MENLSLHGPFSKDSILCGLKALHLKDKLTNTSKVISTKMQNKFCSHEFASSFYSLSIESLLSQLSLLHIKNIYYKIFLKPLGVPQDFTEKPHSAKP